jgi:hypothetical protein
MATQQEIPMSATPQAFSIQLGMTTYSLTVTYRDIDDGGWLLDIADADGNSLVAGIPLVTGTNLLAQYPDLGFEGGLWVQTDGATPDATPTFDNIGTSSHLYFVASS